MRIIVSALIPVLFCCSASAQLNKLSPFVREVAQRNASANNINTESTNKAKKSPTSRTSTSTEGFITVLVRTDNVETLTNNGCTILSKYDDVYIAKMPQNKILDIASKTEIKRIEASRRCHTTNDRAAQITNANSVWSGSALTNNTAYTGTGVVVGVMDIGFDLTNPTFLSQDGSRLRIKSFWDMIDWTDGGTPMEVGRLYSTEEEIRTKACATDASKYYHGTHTTGSVAGSGFEGNETSIYSGMAPDADICLVANCADEDSLLVPEDKRKLYTTATDLLGFEHIFKYAESVGKPCVINFSEGYYEDMEECELYAEAISKMLGPGKIICSSAGNESYWNSYINKAENVNEVGAFIRTDGNSANFIISSKEPPTFKINKYDDSMLSESKTFSISDIEDDYDNTRTDTLNVYKDGDVKSDVIFRYITHLHKSCFDGNVYVCDLTLENISDNNSLGTSKYALVLCGNAETEASGFGSYFETNDIDNSLTGGSNDHNILFPGSVKDVVTVGAVSYMSIFTSIQGYSYNNWENAKGLLASYSSQGPTKSGLIKPDVVAPGELISAGSSYHPETNKAAREFTYNNRDYAWVYLYGTSMSCPIVTGIIALWLEACPTLTPEQIKETFANTCSMPETGLESPNNQYGYGLINAEAGIDYILRNFADATTVRLPSAKAGKKQYFDLYGRRILDIQNYRGIYIEIENGKSVKKLSAN